MKLIPLNSIFDIKYGNQLDLYKLDSNNRNGINFVSRSSNNLGVVAKIERLDSTEPFPAGLITVTLGGTYVLSSFVQEQPFYTAQNIKVLTPKHEMSYNEKVFYCKAIEMNRFRYTSHGREANETLDTLMVPERVPSHFKNIKVEKILRISEKPILKEKISLNKSSFKRFNLTELFKISSTRDELPSKLAEGSLTPYITSSEFNNGITLYVGDKSDFGANTITANRGGSVGCFFYQPNNYMATPVDVRILTPTFSINPFNALFLITILQMEKYRFNYSRKMGTGRLNHLSILLPEKNGKPDFEFMENYIKSLPYSSSL